MSPERVYLGDVASFEENTTVHSLLVEGRAVDVRSGQFYDLRELVDTYDYVRAGDRILSDVSFRSDRIVYRLRFRLAPVADAGRAVDREDPSPDMRSAVATAVDEGSFNATLDPLAGYYSVTPNGRAAFGSSVSAHRPLWSREDTTSRWRRCSRRVVSTRSEPGRPRPSTRTRS